MAAPPTPSEGGLPCGGQRPGRTSAIALAAALIIHGGAAAAVLRLAAPARWAGQAATAIQIDLRSPPAPPPPPALPVPVGPSAAMPPQSLWPARGGARRTAARRAPRPHLTATTLPVFGVIASALQSDPAPVSPPVGDTTGRGDRPTAHAAHTRGAAGGGIGRAVTGGATTTSSGIATRAQVLYAVDSETIYPATPRALGIEGEVETLLDLDDHGAVRSVQITRSAGHGFDEAAREALKRFRFKPALTSEGRPVASRVPWRFTFLLKD